MVIDWTNAIISAVLGVAAGYGAKALVDTSRRVLIRERRLKLMWGFIQDETHVYITLLDKSGVGAAGGYGDMLALAKILTLADRLFGKDAKLLVKASPFDEAASKDKNIIIIGGGKYNTAYLAVVDRLNPPLHFFDTPTVSNASIRNNSNSISYTPEYAPDGAVIADLGLAVSASSPYDSRRRIVILAGSHTYGSTSACEFLTTAASLALVKKELGSSNNFEVVVRGRVENSAVVDIDPLSKVVTF